MHNKHLIYKLIGWKILWVLEVKNLVYEFAPRPSVT